MRRFAVGILIALILPLTACTIAGGDGGYRDYPRYGGHYPPPSDGRWRWDDDLRVYSNVGSPYLYYHDHTYYRWYDNRWSSGSRFNGPWRVIEHRHVPSRLGQRHRSVQRYDDRRVPDRYWNNRDDRSDRRDPRDLRDYRGQSELQRRREALHERHDERRDLRQGQRWQQPRFERQDRQVQQPRFEQRRREVQQRFEGRQDRQPQQQRLEQQRSEGRQQPQWQRPREERRAQQRGDERRQESRQLQQRSEPRQRSERRAVTQSNQDGGHERRSQSRPQQERQGGRQWEGRGGER